MGYVLVGAFWILGIVGGAMMSDPQDTTDWLMVVFWPGYLAGQFLAFVWETIVDELADLRSGP